jgi:proteic killer suppression protein
LYGVITSFRDGETERLWKEERTRRIPADLRKPALKKLQMLNAATALTDLLVPPGNRLERLHGDREGQYTIRINDQYRICFGWRESNAYEVEITDYH